MKQSELERATADFARRIEKLSQVTGDGDIHATAGLFGAIYVTNEGTNELSRRSLR